MIKKALVTGAGGGLGQEFCKLLRADGYEVIEIKRDQFDLAEVGVAERIIKKYPDVDILINNAGFGTHGKFIDTDMLMERNEMQVNMVTLTELTKLYAKQMVQKGSGKILNVASIAAFLPGPLMAVYYASKAYVLSFSEAIANELEGTGVTVTCLCPGPTKTGFADRANLQKTLLFKTALNASDVARVGYEAMTRGEGTVTVGIMNKLQVLGMRMLPRSVNAKIARKLQS